MARVKHKVNVVELFSHFGTKWFWKCETCGKIGKRNREEDIVRKAARMHIAHKKVPPLPGGRMRTQGLSI